MAGTPQWELVKGRFLEALALNGEQRRTWLRDLADRDPGMHEEVQSLLAAHYTDDAVIDRSALDMTDAALLATGNEDRWIGRALGAYLITGPLGRGGMGEVYRARRADAAYDKEVAIKLVRTGFDSAHVVERFRGERQILDDLDHPHIAHLLDGGATDEGLPYLVMELVDGEPIDAYCRSHHLPLDERLRLFQQVCAAVSYAHQRLLIHRDLKPNNVLVTRSGEVKLLDFGIARLLQDQAAASPDSRAETTVLALTPAFASPEQLSSEPLTTATDIYSLGVVLYHLVAGRGPYRAPSGATAEVIREVCESDPRPPSRLADAAHKLPRREARDLDDIVLRAMRREPSARYASADALSDDIARFLDGLPIAAHRGTRAYVLRKLLRRHRLEAASIAAVIVALIVAVLISASAARTARIAQSQAEHNLQRAHALADALLFDVHDAIEKVPGVLDARRILVARAVEYLDQMAEEAHDDVALRRDLATAYERLGEIQGGAFGANMGDTAGAEQSLRKAIGLLDPVVAAPEHELADKVALARALRTHADILVTMNTRLDDARAQLERAVQLGERARQQLPRDTQVLNELVHDYSDLAGVLGSNWISATLGLQEQAAELNRRQVQLAQALVALEPDNRSYARELHDQDPGNMEYRTVAGRTREALHDFETAAEEFRAVLAVSAASPDAVRNLAATNARIGFAHLALGDPLAAEQDFRAALEKSTVVDQARDSESARYTLADIYAGLGLTSLAAHPKSGAAGATGACEWFARARQVSAQIREPGALNADGFYAMAPAVLKSKAALCPGTAPVAGDPRRNSGAG